MVSDVYSIISKYAKLVSGLEFSAGEDQKIVFRSEGRCYMTLPGADLSDLKESDIVDVTDEGEGDLHVVSALMRSKTLRAMFICEPPYTGICIESHHEIEAVLDDMAQIAGPKIEIVSSEEKEIEKALSRASSVMIDSGYLVAAGRSLYEAFTNLLVVEKSAEVTLKSQVIGGVKLLGHGFSKRMHRNYLKNYSAEEEKYRSIAESAQEDGQESGGAGEERPDSAFVQKTAEDSAFDAAPARSPEEQEKREALVSYGKELVKAGLVQGTWGNLSIRLDEGRMICTPSGIDYERLTPDDMVVVDIRTLKYEGEHKPTSEKSLHAGIYRTYPGANAVIHTHSKYVSVFAASEMPLQVEDMGKIARVGEMIGISRYALAGTNKLTKYAIAAMKSAPGCILSHHGMVAYGADIKEAYENAAAIEEAAREYIDKRWE